MQEQYNQYHSPYVGMGNNPISGVDPNGGSSISQAQYWQQGFRSKSWQSKLGEAGIFGYEDARPFLKTPMERFYATMMYEAVRYRNNMTAFDNFWGWYNSRFEISPLDEELNALIAEQAANARTALDASDAGRSSPSKINAPRTVLQKVPAEPVRPVHPLSSIGFSLVSAAIQEENLNLVNVNMESSSNVASSQGDINSTNTGSPDWVNTTSTVLTASGIGRNAKSGLIDIAAKSDPSINNLKYVKGLNAVGKFTGATSAVFAWTDYANNPTTGNLIQTVSSTGLVFVRVNPFVGLGLGILDVTGASDYLYDQLGNTIDNF